MAMTIARGAAGGIAKRRIGASLGLTPRPIGMVCAVVMGVLTIDAVVRERGDLDYRLLNAVQRVDVPLIEPVFRAVSRLTSSPWAILAWAVVAVTFVAARWWLAATAACLVPVGVGINNMLISDLLIHRDRPDVDRLRHLIGETSETSFPSGHVVGAVLLYGLVFMVAGRHLRRNAVRRLVQGGALAVIVLVGPARLWLGTHWISDVVAAYAFGGLLLTVLSVVYRRLAPTMDGVPLVHAITIPHRESEPHAHALTSTILFRGDTVAKIYAPGFVPRALYWLAFQAPFGYEANPLALRAAVPRRNLAGLLTEYWYGQNRVAPALGIERINGRDALIGAFVDGVEPRDHHAARAFLFDLADRFDAAGLPTWQIDPRQPRSLGNILERPDGTYTIIDLESGIVSPLASPRAWWHAIRRGLVPFYDDVSFDLTREYVASEADAMRATRGEAWLTNLQRQLDAAEAAANAWHASEPRIWSRLVRAVSAAVGAPVIPTARP